MKRIFVFVLLAAILPAAAFADFQLGGIAMYKGDPSAATGISASDFTFGGEARLKIAIFQAGVSALYIPYPNYTSIGALTDVGLSLDVLFFRFGAGIGPNFVMNFGNGAPNSASIGWNLKFMGDVNLGGLALGVVGYYKFEDFNNVGSVFSKLPWLGVTLMFRLF
jgi:hypothetical protein